MTKKVSKKVETVKKIENVSTKERVDYIVGPGKATEEVITDLMEGKPFFRKGAEHCWVKRRLVLGDLAGNERIEKLASKEGKRGQVCKLLCEKGEISRDDYKKYNAWGDIRFIKEFVNEEVREGVTYYVLREDVKAALVKNKKDGVV